ncbi:MAG: type II toxin-antitoxin system HicB family antitoxin [Chloroflexi bacterium]|nr:type II toxin-antitoxin system HicB family antitoxin [Chloroflexota bacterium]
MKFTVILEPEEGGGYSVHCPVLPGCVSQGDNRQEALTNIVEAIEGILSVREKHGMPVPDETPELVANEIRECLEARKEEGLPLTIETEEVEIAGKVAV